MCCVVGDFCSHTRAIFLFYFFFPFIFEMMISHIYFSLSRPCAFVLIAHCNRNKHTKCWQHHSTNNGATDQKACLTLFFSVWLVFTLGSNHNNNRPSGNQFPITTYTYNFSLILGFCKEIKPISKWNCTSAKVLVNFCYFFFPL